MSKDDEDEVAKAIDFSQLGKDDTTDDHHESIIKRPYKQYGEINSVRSIERYAMRNLNLTRSNIERLSGGVGGLNAAATAVKQFNSIQLALDISGIGKLQNAIDATGVSFASRTIQDIGGSSAIMRMVQDMQERSNMLSQLTGGMDGQMSAIFRLVRDMDASRMVQAVKALDMPLIGSAIKALDLGRFGSAVETANAAHQLGLSQTFGTDFASATAHLTGRIQSVGQIGRITTAADLNFDVAGKLEGMLARSVSAQEVLLEEHRQARGDAKLEAKFNRRQSIIMAIITVLMFFLMLEERLSDGDVAIRANTTALIEAQVAFDSIATGMDSMREAQEEDAERRQDADEGIAEILRDIAGILAEQAEDNDSVDGSQDALEMTAPAVCPSTLPAPSQVPETDKVTKPFKKPKS